MPSSPNYKRNYKQEKKTAKARGDNEGDRRRSKDRRKWKKANGKTRVPKGKNLDHPKKGAKGRPKLKSSRANKAHGGRIGNRNGKSAGGKKGGKKSR
jgi:hypothetical protein